jgi:hypothetical protein
MVMYRGAVASAGSVEARSTSDSPIRSMLGWA